MHEQGSPVLHVRLLGDSEVGQEIRGMLGALTLETQQVPGLRGRRL